MTRSFALLASAAVVVGLGAATLVVWRGGDDDLFAPCRRSVATGEALIGGPFALDDPSGNRVTETEAISGPTLVYFGYTFCPDFCPSDLARNAAAVDLLAESGVEIDQVFISVDPARDTPEVVGGFTEAIHPDLLGLTGTEDEVAAAARAYRVFFRIGEGDDEFYPVDHSTFTYLMHPEHGMLEFFPSDQTASQLAETVACYAERL